MSHAFECWAGRTGGTCRPDCSCSCHVLVRWKADPNEGGTLMTVEASQIRLSPGDWPSEIRVETPAHGLEDEPSTEPFFKGGAQIENGELTGYAYRSRLWGRTLLVIND